MSENYTGTKFKTLLKKKKLKQSAKTKELSKWCKTFKRLNLAPSYGNGSAGNLSVRTKEGFIITASYTDLGNVSEKDLVKVISYSTKSVKAQGLKEPSSEALMHAAIYKKRPEVNAIFHGHSDEMLNSKFMFTETKRKTSYGSIEQTKEVIKILGNNDLILIKAHGFISLGKSMAEAGSLAKNTLKKITSC